MRSLHRMSQAVSLILPALFLGLVLSCGSDTKKTEEAAPCASADSIVAEATFASLWTNVFDARCGSCHGASALGTEGGPDLRTRETFLSQLKGKTVAADYKDWFTARSNLDDECQTTPIIKAEAASASLLVAIFDATAVSLKCKVKAHKLAPQNICISNGSLANLKKWIDNGAAQ